MMRPAKFKKCTFEAIMAALAISASACFSEVIAGERRSDAVIFDLAQPINAPDNFNWFFVDDGSGARTPRREQGAHQAMWEPLFILDYSTGALEPWLAAAPMTVDATMKVWTLKLRERIEWSDGKPFTADDVVFTVNLALNENIDIPAMEAVTLRSQVENAAKVDPLTVQFTLRRPNPRFALENFGAGRFGSFLIMPKHIWEKVKNPEKSLATYKFNPPVGTGPYKLKSADETQIVWELNDNWWGAKIDDVKDGPDSDTLPDKRIRWRPLPEPKQLIWRHVADDFASKELIEANEIDAARPFTIEAFQEAKTKNPDIVGWDDASGLSWNDPCARQLEINLAYQVDGKPGPWSGADGAPLRQALSLLIDRKKLAIDAYGDSTVPSETMLPKYGGIQPMIDSIVLKNLGVAPEARPAEAEALLNTIGYKKIDGFYSKDGVELAIAIIVNDDLPKEVAAVKALAKQLTDAGIKTKHDPYSKEKYWGEVIPKGLYEMTYSWLSCGSIAEPWTSMSRYTADKAVPVGDRSPGLSNTGRWKNDTYTNAVNALAQKALDDKAGIENDVVAAYAELSKDMPFIPLVQSPTTIPFSTKYWTGWPSAELCEPSIDEPAPDETPTTEPGDEQPEAGPEFPTCLVPMHSWAATHRLIRSLKKAN